MKLTFKHLLFEDEDHKKLSEYEVKKFVVYKLHYKMMMPNGDIINREINDKSEWGSIPIKQALSLLIIKHAPKWFTREHLDSLPVKIMDLNLRFNRADIISRPYNEWKRQPKRVDFEKE